MKKRRKIIYDYWLMAGKGKNRSIMSLHYTKESAIRAKKKLMTKKDRKSWESNPRIVDVKKSVRYR